MSYLVGAFLILSNNNKYFFCSFVAHRLAGAFFVLLSQNETTPFGAAFGRPDEGTRKLKGGNIEWVG
jgi:hypothetical protein